MPHRARGCPFITNVDGEDFVVDGITKYDGYGDECWGIKFAGIAVFQDAEEKLIFPFRFEYSYETDEYMYLIFRVGHCPHEDPETFATVALTFLKDAGCLTSSNTSSSS